MGKPLRVLVIEDSEDDALLMVHALRKGGYDTTYERVETPEAMQDALRREAWDIVLSDFSMPHFGGIAALDLLKKTGIVIPFIIVSGKIGEEAALELMKAGAQDCIMKTNLSRLARAVEQQLKDAESRIQHKQMTKALSASEERFRLLYENSDDAILLTAPDGRIFSANPSACRIFGRTEAEICRMGRDGVIDPGDPRLPAALEERERTGKFRGELTFLRSDDRAFPGELTSVVYRDKEGQPRTSMIIRDISKRKSTEETLRESEKRYKRLVESSPDIVWSFSDKRGTLYVSVQAQVILGYSPDYLYKNPWLWNESIHSDDKERVSRSIADFAAGKALDVEYRIKNIAGDWLWFHDRSIGRQVEGSETIIEGISTDVTLRKRAHDELRDREKELAAIYESAPLIMLIVDKEWKVKKTNAFASQLTNRSVADMLDLRCGEALRCSHALDTPEGCGFGPACRECALRLNAMDTIETGQSHHEVEINMFLSDGAKERDAVFLVSTRELVIKGNPMALVSIQDISKRKKTEDALRESEDKYRSLAATADSMYLVDMNGRYLFMNEGHAKRFALITDRIIGRTFGDFHSEKATKEFMDKVDEVFITGRSIQHEYQSERDGRYFLRTFSPVKDPDEWATVAVSVVSKDITDRKKTEEMLMETQQRLSDIINFLPDATFAVDRDGKVLAWNHAIEEMTGVKAKDILGKGDYEYALPFYGVRRPIMIDLVFQFDEEIKQKYFYVEKRGDYLFGEAETHEAGGNRIVWGVAGPLFDKTGNPVGAIETIRDITGIKMQEKMLESSREQLRALAGRLQSAREEERKQMAREIHDDLGGAMTGLKIDLSHITAGLLEIGNDARRESCLYEAAEMAKLIDSMIHTVRGIMMELRPSVLDDFGLVAAIEWHLQDFQKRTGIQYEFISTLEQIDLNEEYYTSIYRIVQESLTNVARHANASKVTVTFGEKSGNVILEVKDNGMGIRKEQVAGSKSLGLLGMRERALLIGGTVDVSGSPGKGTTVLVQIPLKS